MWDKSLPRVEEYLSVLESASADFTKGKLSLSLRASANIAAHNLAGILDRLGMTKSTILAREIEFFYSGEPEAANEDGAQLHEITSRLRALCEARKSAGAPMPGPKLLLPIQRADELRRK